MGVRVPAWTGEDRRRGLEWLPDRDALEVLGKAVAADTACCGWDGCGHCKTTGRVSWTDLGTQPRFSQPCGNQITVELVDVFMSRDCENETRLRKHGVRSKNWCSV